MITVQKGNVFTTFYKIGIANNRIQMIDAAYKKIGCQWKKTYIQF